MKNNINVETMKKLEKNIARYEEDFRAETAAGYIKDAAETHSRIMGMIEVIVTLGYDIGHDKNGKTIIVGI